MGVLSAHWRSDHGPLTSSAKHKRQTSAVRDFLSARELFRRSKRALDPLGLVHHVRSRIVCCRFGHKFPTWLSAADVSVVSTRVLDDIYIRVWLFISSIERVSMVQKLWRSVGPLQLLPYDGIRLLVKARQTKHVLLLVELNAKLRWLNSRP